MANEHAPLPGSREWIIFKKAVFSNVLLEIDKVISQLQQSIESGTNVLDSAYRVGLSLLITQSDGLPYITAAQWYGPKFNRLLDLYARSVEDTNEEEAVKFTDDSYVNLFTDEDGAFGSALGFLTTDQRIREVLGSQIQRENTPPPPINSWECRIGGSKFLVPPTNVTVSNNYKTSSMTGGVIRQQTTAKFNSGHSETIIDMRLYFPNQDSVWGIGDADELDINFHTASDAVIDRFLSSLRGLITQFRYTPFLPVRHNLLNSVYGVTGVTLNNLSVSTIPDFPLCFVVDLRMKAFNHKVFLPPIEDFNQAVHWGRFRQYVGRAAQTMAHNISRGFLVEYDKKADDNPISYDYEAEGFTTFKRLQEILDGREMRLYYPRKVPGRIFTADMANYRQQGEDVDIGRAKSSWEALLGRLGVDVNTNPQATYNYVNSSSNIVSGDFSGRTAMLEYLRNLNVINSPEGMTNELLQEFIDKSLKKYEDENGPLTPAMAEAIANGVRTQWFNFMFNSWKNLPFFQLLSDAKKKQDNLSSINEWDVPMDPFELDPTRVVLNGVSVNLSNNFATLQLQMQEDPTYQHIGGGDSFISMQFTVFGEQALHGFKRVLKHVNGLARLENSRGVLGFLGIKNMVTALCGIKYVLPVKWTTEVVEDTPGVYNVALEFTDFDIFQQRREELSHEQQQELVDQFSKRNPFLRIKQMWGVFNAYPDFPLSVRDDQGKVVGSLDPDYYFRAFQTIDDDIVNWKDDDVVGAGITDLDDPDPVMVDGVEVQEKGEPDEQGSVGSLTKGYKHTVETYLNIQNPTGENHQMLSLTRSGMQLGASSNETNEFTKQQSGIKFKENTAATKHDKPFIEGLTPGTHQMPILDDDPFGQFEKMMTDSQYRDQSGRMVRAFPTYMLWLIDEGGTFAGVKLFDNFYNIQSVIDFSVVSSEDILGDTLVLRLSNLYSKLTTRYNGRLRYPKEYQEALEQAGFDVLMEDDSYAIDDYKDPAIATGDGDGLLYLLGNTYRNIISGTTGSIVEIDRIRLKPGVRVHLRAGYSSSPNALETLFNGTITEVEQGDIVTVTAQSDAIELSPMVNTTSESGHSGKIDGSLFTQSDGLALWLSEPRDLMIRLLTMGASTFKEMIALATENLIFSENKFGIRHFGMMLYDSLSENEREKGEFRYKHLQERAKGFFDPGEDLGQGFGFDAFGGVANTRSGVSALMTAMWTNINRDPDYEIYKRNIYPGNGFGVAQFLGGDTMDGGLAIAAALSQGLNPEELEAPAEVESEGRSLYSTDIARRIMESGGDRYLNEAIAESGQEFQPESDDGFGFGDVFALLLPGASAILNPTVTFKGAGGSLGQLFGLENTVGAQALEFVAPDNNVSELLEKVLGLSKGLDDDGEFDEVSFRAQTYMKSVWDLFQLCAALLPNYIVAVRPFEDRSTVFYGKPHWLYTSGLTPITTGLQRDSDNLKLREQNKELHEMMRELSERASPLADLEDQLGIIEDLGKIDPLSDPNAQFAANGGPTGTAGDLTPGPGNKLSIDQIADLAYSIGGWITEEDLTTAIACCWAESGFKIDAHNGRNGNAYGLWQCQISWHEDKFDGRPAEDLLVDPVFATQVAQKTYKASGNSWQPWSAVTNRTSHFVNKLPEAREAARRRLSGGSPTAAESEPEQPTSPHPTLAQITVSEWYKEEEDASNPIIYEYVYGGIRAPVPVWIDPASGVYTEGADTNVGDVARMLYDKEYSEQQNHAEYKLLVESGKTLDHATRIWKDLRSRFYELTEMQESYETIRGTKPEKDRGTWYPEAYLELGKIFLSMIWQDPRARAWVVIVADKKIDWSQIPTGSGILGSIANNAGGLPVIGGAVAGVAGAAEGVFGTAEDIVAPGLGLLDRIDGNDDGWIDIPDFDKGPSDTAWTFSYVNGLWEVFLDEFGGQESTLGKNEQGGYDLSEAMLAFINDNMVPGILEDNFLAQAVEGVSNFAERNIGALITSVASTIQGVIQLFRASLMQLGYGLNMVGQMQKQANVLNRLYNDSIYYAAGTPGSIERLADNPFTREYGEPVVEIREPFQRIHYINSFQHILNNGIMETLDDVPTTITATSDGEHPVTVHFDKGIASNHQTERVVETGLFWDNVKGKGLFSTLHPLLHPIETARGFTKALTGSSDELMSRRVGLWHLKEGLKDIYGGEILILGNADIRPHDLLYISDSYEEIHGMCEIEQVVHHFTPDMGFITTVTPNALVTINDPARWSMISWVWSWWSVKDYRDTTRSMLYNVADQGSEAYTEGSFSVDDLARSTEKSIKGHLQFTQGSSALVKDLVAARTMGLLNYESVKDDADAGDVAKVTSDFVTGLTNTFTLGLAGELQEFAWDAWDTVRENLLDQHGCYIQYLNRKGEPMDAGLSYAQGVAVGRHHKTSILPNILGLEIETREDGHVRITTDDLLAQLGWNEIDIQHHRKYTSWWIDQVNSQVLEIAGETPGYSPGVMPEVKIGRITHVEDGDTIHLNGGSLKVRLEGVAAPELWDHQNLENNSPYNRGRLATEFLMNVLAEEFPDDPQPEVAVRINPVEPTDRYGRTLGVIFYNTPPGTPDDQKTEVLRRYAANWPPKPWDSYMEDGRPYTLNWAVILSGYASVDTKGLQIADERAGAELFQE